MYIKLKSLARSGAACVTAAVVLLAGQTAWAAETYLTGTRVNFRTGASLDAAVIKTLNKGVSVEVLEYDAENWSSVSVDGVAGYIKSEYLIAAAGAPATETAAKASGALYKTVTRVNFRTGASLEASVIKTLNPGVSVEVLEYDAENWSMVSLNGTSGYIKSEYLISPEAYAGGISDKGVELLEWSVVKEMFTLRRATQIIDIKSGLTYYVQSFSNGLHADVEPLTKADTDILLKTYGGKWSWTPRPVWVNLNGRTIVAAINGMPHGGGTIADNGMNGQICLHFLGSRPHNGNTSYEKDLQATVMEAWNMR